MWTTWRLGVSKGHVGDKNRDKLKMRLFKAQRNLYVTGFTLFFIAVSVMSCLIIIIQLMVDSNQYQKL